MPKMYMVKNDLKPPVEATLKYKDGTVIDLTGCTVRFHLKKDRTIIVDADAAIVEATNGIVRYNWVEGNTNVVGSCKAEFEISFADAKKLTVPTIGDFEIIFREEYA